jgi:hypothetical protein
MKIVQILIKIPAVNSEVLADLKNVESPAWPLIILAWYTTDKIIILPREDKKVEGSST